MSGSISIFIPAYNAEKTLGSVIDRIPASLWNAINRIYVINDGSLDQTRDAIGAIVEKQSACVAVHHERNLGYGETVKHGLKLCCADDCRFAVCLHADGQYPPESIESGVSRMEAMRFDLLLGSRIASGTALLGGMPLYKFAAGKILTMLENRVFGLSLTDYHSGFLIYGRRVLDTVRFDGLSASFDFDLEVIAAARTARFLIGEIPIPTRYAGEVSYLNPVTYGFRVLRVLARYVLGNYRRCIGSAAGTRR